MTVLGFTPQQMTFLGFPSLKKFRARPGKWNLRRPAGRDHPGTGDPGAKRRSRLVQRRQREVKPELVMERLPDGRERLLGLTLWVNGVPQKNVYSPEKANWLTKRLRARKTYLTREQWQRHA